MRRIVLGAVALVVLALAAGAWWLHGNIDGIVKRAIDHYGTQMTGAPVTVGSVQLRTADGAGTVRELVIGNPPGFRSPHAVKVGLIEFAVDVSTLTDPVVRVKRIVIESPDVVYEKGEAMTNFEAIQRNIAKSLASGADGAKQQPASGKPPRKLIVDEFVIRGARAQATSPALLGQSVSTTLPDLVMRDIGRKEGGITPAQLGDRITRALTQRLVTRLGVDKAVKSLGDRVKGLFGR